MDFGLAGKACAVTGASSGIGLETARMLCAEGARVLLVARDPERLAQAATICNDAAAETGGAETLSLDVTEPDAGEAILAEATTRFGQLDVLVNNAGTARWHDLDDVADEDFYAAHELNVMAPLRAMRAAAPPMAQRGWGRIVNVASSSAKRPSPLMPEYSVAKAGELSLSRLFADRYASKGVLVNAICPGPTKSELWVGPGGLAEQSAAHANLKSAAEAIDVAASKRPIGRLAAVEEVAAVIVFLCSEHASFVAGAAWSVDGGTVQVVI